MTNLHHRGHYGTRAKFMTVYDRLCVSIRDLVVIKDE